MTRLGLFLLLPLALAGCGSSSSSRDQGRPDEMQAMNAQRIAECQQIVRSSYMRNALTNMVPKLTSSGRNTTVEINAQVEGGGVPVNYRCVWESGLLTQVGPIR